MKSYIQYAVLFSWEPVYSQRGPNGEREVKIQRRACFTDCAVRVVAIAEGKSTSIAHRTDSVIDFAHAVWIDPVVAAFVDGATCEQLRIAYDTSSAKSMPFENVRSALAESIIQDTQ